MPENKWIGCGECDVSFRCHHGNERCIKLPEPSDLGPIPKDIIDQQWEHFVKTSIGLRAIAIFPVQLQRTLKRTYFSGAAGLMKQLEEVVDKLNEHDSAAMMEGIHQELATFGDDVRAGKQ